MNRKCKRCGGVIGEVSVTTCTCLLVRVDKTDGTQFVATQEEIGSILECLQSDVIEDKRAGINKKQRERDRSCERFLTGYASARYLCKQVGMADLSNDLVPVLCDLQSAHEQLVNHSANRMLIRIVKGLRAKVITAEQAQQLFELDEIALAELLKRLDVKPKKDLADQLSNLKGLKSPGRSRRRI